MTSYLNKLAHLKYLKLLIPISALIFLFHIAKSQLISLDYSLAWAYLSHLSTLDLTIISLSAIVAVSTLIVYDILLLSHFKLPITFKDLLKLSWIANTFNNMFGMGGLTGAGIRTYLYRKYNVTTNLAIYMSFLITLATGTGLAFLGILCLLNILPVGIIFNEHFLLKLILIGSAVYFFLYHIFVYNNHYTKKFIPNNQRNRLRLSFTFFGASLLEWMAAALLFFVISTIVGIDVPFIFMVGLFTIAALAGLTSMIPGGLGTFDLTIMIGFDLFGINPELGLATLIIYRLFYFVLPWLSAMVLASALFLPKRKYMIKQATFVWNNLCEQLNGNICLSRPRKFDTHSLFVFICVTTLLIVSPLGIVKAFFIRDLFIMLSAAIVMQRY